MKVFISHKDADSLQALLLKRAFENEGVSAYLDVLDSSINGGGKTLTEHIKGQLNQCTDTIGRNVAIDYIRHNEKVSDTPLEDFENYLSEEDSVETSYLREERKIAVHKALRKLKAEYRQVLYLIYFEGFSNSEAATTMKKSKHQLENLVYRARMSLRSELDKEGFVYEEL